MGGIYQCREKPNDVSSLSGFGVAEEQWASTCHMPGTIPSRRLKSGFNSTTNSTNKKSNGHEVLQKPT